MLILVFPLSLQGQSVSPTQWYQIRTPYVDIIFRGDIVRESQRLANLLTHLHGTLFYAPEEAGNRFPLIINNQDAHSNAHVGLAPRQMWFSTFPSQNYNFIGANDWLHMLATHEFRHAAQYTHLQQKFNALAYYLGGELMLNGIIAINIPKWFLEGDAIQRETTLSTSGRGRMPNFALLYRTNLLTGKKINYAKQVFSSFKDAIPDEYRIGYFLTAHLRQKFGDAVFMDILQKSTQAFFCTAVRNATKHSIYQIYEDANRALTAHWQAQLVGLKLTQVARLNPRNTTTYLNYNYPQLDQQGRVVVMKSGIGTVAQLVTLDGRQHTQRILTPYGIDQQIRYSIAKDQIVWVATVPDLIRDHRYRVIQRYDCKSRQLKTLTHKSRYGAAALSPDAKKIVAMESDEGYNHQLVILDAQDGKILKRFSNPGNDCYITPAWSTDGTQIIAVKSNSKGITIVCIHATTGAMKDILPYTTEHLGSPVMTARYLFYNSAYSGIDNIYAIDLLTRQQYQVTSRKYGAYHAIVSADEQWLIFNDFTKDGMDVVKMPFDPKMWTPLAQVTPQESHVYAPSSTPSAEASQLLANTPSHTYPVTRYHPWQHPLNTHSWLTIQDMQWNAGYTGLCKQLDVNLLRATDLLNTTELFVNYLYNFNEKFGQAAITLDCKAFYPVISIGGKLVSNSKIDPTCAKQCLKLAVIFPLKFVHRHFMHNVTLSTTGILYHKKYYVGYAQQYKGTLHRTSQKSIRDIYAPWQQMLEFKYFHALSHRRMLLPYLETTLSCRFPGLIKHHSFLFGTTYRSPAIQTWHKVLYELFPKEYPSGTSTPWWLYANYDFPIYYPDWNLGHLLYVKRWRSTLAYNRYGNPHLSSKKQRYGNVLGINILADIHPLILYNIPMLSVGAQYYYTFLTRRGSLRFIAGLLH